MLIAQRTGTSQLPIDTWFRLQLEMWLLTVATKSYNCILRCPLLLGLGKYLPHLSFVLGIRILKRAFD